GGRFSLPTLSCVIVSSCSPACRSTGWRASRSKKSSIRSGAQKRDTPAATNDGCALCRSRGDRYRAAPCHRGRVRHHGRAAGSGQYRCRVARKFHRHWCRLYALIGMLAPVSGGHFNPIVSAVSALPGTLDKRDCAVYVLAQVLGAVCGVVLAHAMFGLPLL